MTSDPPPTLTVHRFERIANFRDVAVSIQESLHRTDPTGHVPILPRLLYRSARPDQASDIDLEYVTKRIGIRTIIDLRSELETNSNHECGLYAQFPLVTAAVLGGPLVDSDAILPGTAEVEPPQPVRTDSASENDSIVSVTDSATSQVGEKPPIDPSGDHRHRHRHHHSYRHHHRSPFRRHRSYRQGDRPPLVSHHTDSSASSSSSSSTTSAPSPKSLEFDHVKRSYSQLSLRSAKHAARALPRQKRYNINLLGSRFRFSFVVGSASWSTRSKLVYYQLRGMKQRMLNTVGREVFEDMGLKGFYAGVLGYCGHEIASVLRLFTERRNFPILVHCSHGKDRTGIIVALLLMLLGVDPLLIVADYAKTREGMKDKLAEIKSDMRATGMPEVFADAPPEAMAETIHHLLGIYGTPSHYLEIIGINRKDQACILRNLTSYGPTTSV
ncbi:hypothetical protein IWQ60_009084 [Tieghemiomyces parasiticus]|uniref:Tyrosine specific protein phosphatases domain-containing protein n=1 Tax=Tieghemiomyces parasiticus TaxID=78921 RepID=A0A9W8DLS0_9FUNG|nr:hypothetical protein IWQ60_009084 [Tieghemiomyces parasiticus]